MEKKYCQSCGMPLNNPDWLGTNINNKKNEEYCFYCVKEGEYTVNVSMDEMIDIWVKYADDYNRYSGSQLSKDELRNILKNRLPNLKRWRQKAETESVYHKAINKVTNYINDNLFGLLDLKTLAPIANLSEYHFHRIFRAVMGENVGEYIQRLRLEFVALKLITTNKTLTQITELTNYTGVFTLSRAFKKHFGVSPLEYRKKSNRVYPPGFGLLSNQFHLMPEIVKIENLHAVYMNIRDAYRFETVYKNAWERLIKYAEKNKLTDKDNNFLSISFDDPTITPINQCRFYIGITVKNPVASKGKIGCMKIPDGNYAVFRYKGEYSSLYKLYNDIYLKWLPNSDYELRNTFSFEIYVNTPLEVNSKDLLTDVYIPIEKKENSKNIEN